MIQEFLEGDSILLKLWAFRGTMYPYKLLICISTADTTVKGDRSHKTDSGAGNTVSGSGAADCRDAAVDGNHGCRGNQRPGVLKVLK